MAVFLIDRVQETTAVTGTGSATLLGAVTGFKDFSTIGDANSTYYTIVGPTEWEVGLGTYSTIGPTLTRDVVYSNSLNTTAKINFSAGTKNIFITAPTALLSKLLVSQTLTIGNGTATVIKQTNINKTFGVTNSGGWLFPQAVTLATLKAYVIGKPNGSSIIIPVKYGATYATSTLLTNITISNNSNASALIKNTTSLPAQTYIYLDITQVGVNNPGSGLSVQIAYSYTAI
jgi:hypothetical protein